MDISQELDNYSDGANNPPPDPKKGFLHKDSKIQSGSSDSRSAPIWIRKEKIAPAFWTVAGLLSLSVNLILLVFLIGIGRQVFLSSSSLLLISCWVVSIGTLCKWIRLLYAPFVGLQNVVAPYYVMLWELPNSWDQVICNKENDPICSFLGLEH